MTNLRSRVAARLGQKYLARVQKKGFAPSKMSFLPDSVLMPLRREGLDPVEDLARKRKRAPIAKVPLPFGMDAWVVTGYDEVKKVLGSADGFSNDFLHLAGKAGVVEDQNPGGLGFSDPPVHTRLRRLLAPEFTMRRLRRLTPRIQAIVDEHLDTMAKSPDPVDLVKSFALPIPFLTICELLGVSGDERREFQQLSTARFDLSGGADASLGAITESLSYLQDVVKKQRDSPGEGLLGMIIKEHGDEIGDRELAGLADGVLTGGLDTTTSMLSLGSMLLLQNPGAFASIRDTDAAVDPFVEEALRYLTVVQLAFPRFAREDIEISGARISKGDIVLCSLSGANRDEASGFDMEQFDPTRNAPSHLAFGYGIHRCVGAELARMELRAAYPALVRRFPGMSLAVDPEELSFRKLSIVYGVESLPVNLSGPS
ncbi:cytochrome P450 [Streptomyces sp. NPDC004647]|uniref:cytochrome P450 n=1 Tax=Streptomyces sp. NPDC004647 TaxID=3154671 RepID=UPI0033B16849